MKSFSLPYLSLETYLHYPTPAINIFLDANRTNYARPLPSIRPDDSIVSPLSVIREYIPGFEGRSLRFKRKDSLKLRRRRKWWRSLIDLTNDKRNEICLGRRTGRTREEGKRIPAYIPNFPREKSTTYRSYNVRHYVQTGTSSSG